MNVDERHETLFNGSLSVVNVHSMNNVMLSNADPVLSPPPQFPNPANSWMDLDFEQDLFGYLSEDTDNIVVTTASTEVNDVTIDDILSQSNDQFLVPPEAIEEFNVVLPKEDLEELNVALPTEPLPKEALFAKKKKTKVVPKLVEILNDGYTKVYELAGGWIKRCTKRKTGQWIGKWDVYLKSAGFKTVRSKFDLQRLFKDYPDQLVNADFLNLSLPEGLDTTEHHRKVAKKTKNEAKPRRNSRRPEGLEEHRKVAKKTKEEAKPKRNRRRPEKEKVLKIVQVLPKEFKETTHSLIVNNNQTVSLTDDKENCTLASQEVTAEPGQPQETVDEANNATIVTEDDTKTKSILVVETENIVKQESISDNLETKLDNESPTPSTIVTEDDRNTKNIVAETENIVKQESTSDNLETKLDNESPTPSTIVTEDDRNTKNIVAETENIVKQESISDNLETKLDNDSTAPSIKRGRGRPNKQTQCGGKVTKKIKKRAFKSLIKTRSMGRRKVHKRTAAVKLLKKETKKMQEEKEEEEKVKVAKFRCFSCNHATHSRDEMMDHCFTVHINQTGLQGGKNSTTSLADKSIKKENNSSLTTTTTTTTTISSSTTVVCDFVDPKTEKMCGKVLTTINGGYIKHFNVHKTDCSFPCNICGKTFNLNCALVVHQQRTHGEKSHVVTLNDDEDEPPSPVAHTFQCQWPVNEMTCSMSFGSHVSLVSHWHQKHREHLPCGCGQCMERVKKSQVKLEQLGHVCDWVSPVNGYMCGHESVTMHALRKHKKLMDHQDRIGQFLPAASVARHLRRKCF